MNLYLVSRTDKLTWGDCDALVCCADSVEEALKVQPYNGNWWRDHWRGPKPEPTVELIGTYIGKETTPTCILANWNDG